jgi:hypothetical protein
MLKKYYFPCLIIPISTIVSGVVDFVVAFVLHYKRQPATDVLMCC